ncbi:MAG: hypothetical protein H6988_10830 [Pseudomonadales bacterium]|nr:hypothetical protein [Halieaceae bacterium]MCP5190870.1 hypothetical protein [Pseudomonadales bacterium]
MTNQVKKDGGEGDREAARRYNQKTEEFTESDEGQDAIDKGPQWRDEQGAKEAGKAEETGRKRAREMDPQVTRDYSNPDK